MDKLLLVEDNEMNRDMLTRRLQRKGFEVVIALDGEEAVEKARTESQDLILMDLSLPVVDGWEATRRIKQSAETGQIPIIALTSHAMAGDREQALRTGCAEYDTKPVDFFRLQSKIRTLINERVV